AAVEGVGPLVATALVAAVGNATDFRSGRELAAYLGLVPRHRASGGRTALLRIERQRSTRAIWAARLKLRRGSNVAAVALANKNARVLWALLNRHQSYQPAPFPARVPQSG